MLVIQKGFDLPASSRERNPATNSWTPYSVILAVCSLPYQGWCTLSTCHWSRAHFGLKVTFLYSFDLLLYIYAFLRHSANCQNKKFGHLVKDITYITLLSFSPRQEMLSSAMFVLFTLHTSIHVYLL